MKHFIKLEDLQNKEVFKGATLDFFNTEHLTVAYTTLKAGGEIPLHHHPEEAADIILEGELQMQIGEAVSILKPGMISLVPSNISHRAKAITDSKVVTIFYPRRENFK